MQIQNIWSSYLAKPNNQNPSFTGTILIGGYNTILTLINFLRSTLHGLLCYATRSITFSDLRISTVGNLLCVYTLLKQVSTN